MMWLGDPNLWVRSGTPLTSELEGDHPSQIGLEGQDLEVHHELNVIFPILGYAGWSLEGD